MSRDVKLESIVRRGFRWGVALIAVLISDPAAAAVLNVGPGEAFSLPSEAIRAATSGDTIRIAPGMYRDCAAWKKDGLVVEGAGEGVVLAGAICKDKGIFIVGAPSATIRNIAFEGAANAEGNGSGIRSESLNLVVENCTFRNNQDGILTANTRGATVTIRDSAFDGNGACVPGQGCAHAVYIGHVDLVRIERSRFVNSKVGHHVKSRARRTELIDNTIEDGDQGTSSYLVNIPNGGSLLMVGNTLEKGPNTQNPSAAISIGEEGSRRPPREVTITGNIFSNNGPRTVFVRNMTKTEARLSGNVVKGPARVLTGPGSVN